MLRAEGWGGGAAAETTRGVAGRRCCWLLAALHALGRERRAGRPVQTASISSGPVYDNQNTQLGCLIHRQCRALGSEGCLLALNRDQFQLTASRYPNPHRLCNRGLICGGQSSQFDEREGGQGCTAAATRPSPELARARPPAAMAASGDTEFLRYHQFKVIGRRGPGPIVKEYRLQLASWRESGARRPPPPPRRRPALRLPSLGLTLPRLARPPQVSGVMFECPAHLTPIKPIGKGAYGIVCSATDTRTSEKVAIKKIGARRRAAAPLGGHAGRPPPLPAARVLAGLSRAQGNGGRAAGGRLLTAAAPPQDRS